MDNFINPVVAGEVLAMMDLMLYQISMLKENCARATPARGAGA